MWSEATDVNSIRIEILKGVLDLEVLHGAKWCINLMVVMLVAGFVLIQRMSQILDTDWRFLDRREIFK